MKNIKEQIAIWEDSQSHIFPPGTTRYLTNIDCINVLKGSSKNDYAHYINTNMKFESTENLEKKSVVVVFLCSSNIFLYKVYFSTEVVPVYIQFIKLLFF